MFRTIVMATDGSAAVERLLVYVQHLARHSGGQVIVVHAYEPPTVYEWTESYKELAAHYDRVAQEVAEDAVDALVREGIQATADVRRGPAAEAILEAARVHEADLIVMGSRAQKSDSMTEALLGSVSSAVVRSTYCPTLLVP
ncbi:MAG TPA: universal stress protein [Caldilineaceae bacterium]|nr:universal stress protein [Caldilineaceae bacterium]